MYNNYKQARDKSWEILIKTGVTKLPISFNDILTHLDVDVLFYHDLIGKTLSDKLIDSDGYTTLVDGRKTIYLNEKKGTTQRRRFTMAHEIGHVVLNHPLKPTAYRNSEIDEGQKPNEIQANVFARDLLMPAGVLAALHVTTVDEIIQICNVSRISAQIRLERLTELYKRNKFGAHPLERQVISQFSDFIKNNK